MVGRSHAINMPLGYLVIAKHNPFARIKVMGNGKSIFLECRVCKGIRVGYEMSFFVEVGAQYIN